jgi:galactitol-specific phosphotransferase system IIC component
MSLIDDLKGNVVSGLLIGIGAAILAPVVLPILASIAKPVAKAAVKGGIMMYEKGKEVVAETGEMLEDIVAEAKAELAEEQHAAEAGAGTAGEAMENIKNTFAPGEGRT